ncbi:MAG: hypothetical protein MUQ65_00640, partial [Armatimonadetes bacterium]|nr:hypothetical protein [Armatimonadota bacterium]
MATLAEKDTTGTLRAGEGEIELLDRRTRTAKVFHLGGRRYRIGASLGPVHYRRDPFDEGEGLKEIDLSLTPTPGEEWDFACETNGYQVRVWNSREVGGRTLRCVAQYRRAGRWFEMAPVALAWMNGAGERELIAKPVASAPTIEQEPDRVLWRDAFGAGLDFCYTLSPDHFWKAVVVREKAALPRPTIDRAGLRLVVVMAVAWEGEARAGNGFGDAAGVALDDDESVLDAADEELSEPEEFDYRDVADRPLWWLRKPRAWDSSEEQQAFEMGWQLRRRGGSVRMLLAIDAQVLADESVVYPVYIDTSISEEQPVINGDDAHSSGAVYPGFASFTLSGSLRVGRNSSNWYCCGVRYQTVPIPAGATIDSAALSFSPANTRWDNVIVYRAAEDVDSAAVFSSTHMPGGTAYNSRTTAKVYWDIPNWTAYVWDDSPDLATVVQEVVDRGGWASNNNLLFILYETRTVLPGGFVYRTIQDYGTGNGVKFNCTYSEPGSGGDWLF